MSPAAEAEVAGLLGLAQRSGALAAGVDATREKVRTGTARLVVMAADAAPGQLKKVRGILSHRDIPLRWVPTREALGRSVGRPPTSVVAVTSHSFAEQLVKRLPATPSGGR